MWRSEYLFCGRSDFCAEVYAYKTFELRYTSDFSTIGDTFISDTELLDCLRHVLQPHSSISAVAMYNHLKLVAESVALPKIANEFHRDVLPKWEAMRDVATVARKWGEGGQQEEWQKTALRGCRQHVTYADIGHWKNISTRSSQRP